LVESKDNGAEFYGGAQKPENSYCLAKKLHRQSDVYNAHVGLIRNTD